MLVGTKRTGHALRSQLLSSFAPAVAEHTAAAFAGHALAETVVLFPF